jgi:hypothetical protein
MSSLRMLISPTSLDSMSKEGPRSKSSTLRTIPAPVSRVVRRSLTRNLQRSRPGSDSFGPTLLQSTSNGSRPGPYRLKGGPGAHELV